MDRGFKQIVWMTWSLRSRILCSNYVISNRITQTTSQTYWTSRKERLEPLKKIMQESEIHSLKDSIRILNTINDNRLNMDLRDTIDVLTALVQIAAQDRNQLNFVNHRGFQMLCEQLQKKVRVMSLPEVVESIKLLSFLNVPASTVLMQSLLQIIRNSVNDLSLDQVHLLLYILKKMEHTSLSTALLIALPILIPNIIKTKVNHSDIRELSVALLCLKNEEQKDLIAQICENIQSVIKVNPTDASVSVFKNIFKSLCSMPEGKHSRIMLDTIETVEKILFNKTHMLSLSDILGCIDAISCKANKQRIDTFTITFLNTLLEILISRHVDSLYGFKVLKHLNAMQYTYMPFIEYLLNKPLPKHISNANLSTLLIALSIADYKSIPWSYLEDKICHEDFLNKHFTHMLICSVYLASLDKYYPQVLSSVFTKTKDLNLESYVHSDTYRRLLVLYQSTKTLYPEYTGPWPSNDILGYICKLNFPKRSILKNQLQVAIGGPQYVLSCLRTRLGHYVDHAIIMRKGGYPIAFNTDDSYVLADYTNYIEELKYPPESYVILILELPRIAYSLNTSCLLNVWRLQLKSLQKWTGHKCIDVNVDYWSSLPNHEKTSYLMQKIIDECDDIGPKV